jgi:hypothetical protein
VVPNHTPLRLPPAMVNGTHSKNSNGREPSSRRFHGHNSLSKKSDKSAKDQARKSHQCRTSVSEDASTLLPGWLLPQQSEGGVLIARYMGVVPNHTPNTHWLKPRSEHTTSKRSTTPWFEKRGFVTLTTNRGQAKKGCGSEPHPVASTAVPVTNQAKTLQALFAKPRASPSTTAREP